MTQNLLMTSCECLGHDVYFIVILNIPWVPLLTYAQELAAAETDPEEKIAITQEHKSFECILKILFLHQWRYGTDIPPEVQAKLAPGYLGICATADETPQARLMLPIFIFEACMLSVAKFCTAPQLVTLLCGDALKRRCNCDLGAVVTYQETYIAVFVKHVLESCSQIGDARKSLSGLEAALDGEKPFGKKLRACISELLVLTGSHGKQQVSTELKQQITTSWRDVSCVGNALAIVFRTKKLGLQFLAVAEAGLEVAGPLETFTKKTLPRLRELVNGDFDVHAFLVASQSVSTLLQMDSTAWTTYWASSEASVLVLQLAASLTELWDWAAEGFISKFQAAMGKVFACGQEAGDHHDAANDFFDGTFPFEIVHLISKFDLRKIETPDLKHLKDPRACICSR